MKRKLTSRTRKDKSTATSDENDFAYLDSWAQSLNLKAGRPLTAGEHRVEGLARRVGRPLKSR